MKIIKIANKSIITDEMREWFEERTKRHIAGVEKYCKKIMVKYPEFKGLGKRIGEHDQTKFVVPEIDPYILITWKYKCADDGTEWTEWTEWEVPEGLDERMNEATEHHINSNRHHPEFHASRRGKINSRDRDAIPEEMVDATGMEDIDIAEMVADWCSVSEERGNSPRGWADKNVNKRWKFTDSQVDLIYELIDEIWD